ncbi:MAG: CCA tRNA nucleotidyltransferase [Pirellulales bacterium]|nr:CCA tRNA nucleotidyltransferase [Pirellulales bacterium]
MVSPDSQRDFALQIVEQLRAAGYEAFWAGGCVRDQLLGRVPKDYDVATGARPEQVRELFGPRRTLAIGAAFGVISVLGRRNLDSIEVATFRSDGAYIDGRHPQSIVFSSVEEDARRRDFTINGLFFDPVQRQVIDYVGGQQDIHGQVVRAIGDAAARFGEDKLRMLRAVRFAAAFGFEIESATFSAIQQMAGEVHVVSAERIGSELRRILVHPSRGLGLHLLLETGLLAALLPNVARRFEECQETWEQARDALGRLKSVSLSVALATLFWGICDESDIRRHGRAFRFSNKEIERAAWLVGSLPAVAAAKRLPWPKLQPRLVHAGSADLMAVAEAVLGVDDEGCAFCEAKLQLPPEQLNPPLLVSGDDLVACGLQPGREFAELLDRVREVQLDGRIGNREQALELIDGWVRERGGR